SAARDAARTVKLAVLVAADTRTAVPGVASSAEATPPLDGSQTRPHTGTGLHAATGKLNANQQLLIDSMKASRGRVPVETLQGLNVPRTTLSMLVRRGLIEIIEEPQDFTVSKIRARRSPFEFDFSAQQKKALERILAAASGRKFAGALLH